MLSKVIAGLFLIYLSIVLVQNDFKKDVGEKNPDYKHIRQGCIRNHVSLLQE